MKNDKKLTDLRNDIDKIDFKIIDLLKKRGDLSVRIANYKKMHGLAILQPEREEKALKKRINYANKSILSSSFIIRLFKVIFLESKKQQKNGKIIVKL
ncbi:chorismate mutase [Pseudomonadota bacterium]